MDIPNLDRALLALHYYAQQMRAFHPIAGSISDHEFDINTLVAEASERVRDYLGYSSTT
jgi:hypothetical protein